MADSNSTIEKEPVFSICYGDGKSEKCGLRNSNEPFSETAAVPTSPEARLRGVRTQLERAREDVAGEARVTLTAAVATVQIARLQAAGRSEQGGYVQATAGPSGPARGGDG